ncbi:MAG: S26 family signal peptidase [Rhizobiales bacterium]|nr:S26 family signal peptidase [Hyphomicrobiales bacterium]
MLAAPILSRHPVILYNASGSAPLGFYRVEDRLPRRGEMAVVRPPPIIEVAIVARGFLPPGVPLVKRVAAVGGDQVCREKGVITVNGEPAAEALDRDRQDRPLPAWEGCIALINGEFFLIQPHPYSFDSRYFGPVLRCDVVGVAVPLWTWSPTE